LWEGSWSGFLSFGRLSLRKERQRILFTEKFLSLKSIRREMRRFGSSQCITASQPVETGKTMEFAPGIYRERRQSDSSGSVAREWRL
jgi:hypothetical protein